MTATIDTPSSATDVRELTLRWPWWMHPIWAVFLLTGITAIVSIVLPESSYAQWKTPKYVEGEQAGLLVLGISVFLLGILLTSARVLGSGSVTLRFDSRQLRYLRRAYLIMLGLAGFGYVIWSGSAVLQGVDLSALTNVLFREQGAISSLKSSSRPIAGLTTLTQFGPLVVVLGIVLRKLGVVGRWHYWIFFLAAFRGIFYAERLALIEVLVPGVVLISALAYGSGKRVALLRVMPIVIGPLALGFFAIFEYMRSWVYYQNVVSIPFGEWVSLRLLGYYATSFNNSAMLDGLLTERPVSGLILTVPFFWNFPLVEMFASPPTISGWPMGEWWWWALNTMGNPEFTNSGSFLLTHAELGTGGMIAYWLITGIIVGVIYAAMRRGSIIAVLAYACIFVGLLELPRFIYWTQGRATPVIIALIILAFTYPRGDKKTAEKSRPLTTR